jgi:hypothetical protein
MERHLLKANLCGSGWRKEVDGGKSVNGWRMPFFKRHLLKANCERDTRVIACTVSSAGGRTNRNWASGSSHVN